MALPENIVPKTTQTKFMKIESAFRKISPNRSGNWLQEKGIVVTKMGGWQDGDNEKSVEHPDGSYELYQKIYWKVPVAKISVDHTANFAIQAGYELEGNLSDVHKIEEWMDKVNFNLLLLDAMKQMQIYGNAYLEISDIESPKFLPVNQMFVVVSKGDSDNGKILGYKQRTNSREPIPFNTDEIIHFKWNTQSGLPESGFYGVSDFGSAVQTLTRLLNFQEDIGNVVHRHAEPTIHWIVGTENSPGTNTQIEAVKSDLADREKGGDLITSFGVEGKVIGTDLRMIQPEGIIEHFENQLIAAFQVPEIYIRGGKTANKATADVEERAFDKRVKAMMSIASTYVEDYIFPKITSGKVKMVWNEPTFETESKKAEMIERMTKGGFPLEVSMKIVGWGAFINDLQLAGGQVMPMMPSKNGDDKPEKKPKEEDFDTQVDYIKAYEEWKGRNK